MLFMSITAGIQICVKDKNGKYIANRNKGVSWKNRYIDLWMFEYIFKYKDQLIAIKSEDTDECRNYIIPKSVIKQLAEDLMTQKFKICPDAYEFIEDPFSDELTAEEKTLISYGQQLKQLYDSLQNNEFFVYY